MSIQQASLATRGAWHETLCLLWHNGTSRHTNTVEGWSKLWRCGTQTAEECISEIEALGIGCVTRHADGTVTLMSRRLHKEAIRREAERLRKAKQRCPDDVPNGKTGTVPPRVPPHVPGRGQEAKRLRGTKEEDSLNGSEQEFLEAWGGLGKPFTKLRRLGTRRRALRLRLGDEWWREHYKAALEKMKVTLFLKGENDRGWVADLTFFLRPDSVAKILEGTYDGKRGGGRRGTSYDAEGKFDGL